MASGRLGGANFLMADGIAAATVRAYAREGARVAALDIEDEVETRSQFGETVQVLIAKLIVPRRPNWRCRP